MRGFPQGIPAAGAMAGMIGATQTGGLALGLRFERSMLESAIVKELKRGHTALSPDVWLVRINNELAVWKDYGRRGALGRAWGRYVIHRETRALEILSDVEGVPHLLGRVGTTGLVMSFCSGTIVPRRGIRQFLQPEFFDRASTLLHEIHRCGVAHADIRRKNILVRPDGSPALIDFQTAVLRGESWWRSWLFAFFCRVDEWNLLRIKAKSFPHFLTEEEQRKLACPPFWLRVGRFLRRDLYRRVKPKTREQ
ncbi:MAG: RIO1 family regulatory kinase/ATPase [Candidatus Sumerlaeaceae bacterium]